MITIRTKASFWSRWTAIAIDNEKHALKAREEAMVASLAQHDAAEAIVHESAASLVAIVACAFALDALGSTVADILAAAKREKGTTPANEPSWISALFARWIRRVSARPRRSPRHKVIFNNLRRGFRIKGRAGAGYWVEELKWLFNKRRNVAVHYQEAWKATSPHPLGLETTPETVMFSLEPCQRAVDLLLEVLRTCKDSPREELEDWAMSNSGGIQNHLDNRIPVSRLCRMTTEAEP